MKKCLLKGLIMFFSALMLSGLITPVEAKKPPDVPHGPKKDRTTPVPEPATLGLLGAGIVGVGAYFIAKKKRDK